MLVDEGADLSGVVFGYSGDVNQPDYLQAMANAGLTLGLDRFGIDHFASFTDLLPYLRSRGVTDDQIEAMLVRAPARVLAGPVSP